MADALWPKLPCRWTHDDDNGIWNTACGEAHLFEDGGPTENAHRFCPYCGGELVAGAPGVALPPAGKSMVDTGWSDAARKAHDEKRASGVPGLHTEQGESGA